MVGMAAEEVGRVLALPTAPESIELRHLRAFVAVAEELNFGRAAARLYLSAPALSRQISGLERLLGCQLLRRSTHRVELTLAGEAMLTCAHSLLRELDTGVAATRAVGGELRSRANRIWEPVTDIAIGGDLHELRAAFEAVHGQFTPPPEVGIRPVNAGGVPSLVLTPGTDRPTRLLYLHGGGFVMGSAFGYRPLAGALAVAADLTVLVPEIRLAPEHPFPAALDDATSAYLWLLDQGAPAEAITIAGDSSGASLVMSLLLTLRSQDLPQPGGAALLCPGLDVTLSCFHEMPTDPALPLLVSLAQIRGFIDAYLAGHPTDDPLLNPLTTDLTGLPPLLVQAATGDYVVEEAHRLTDNARAHGVEVHLELYPADTHVFQIFWPFLPEAADAVSQVGDFVRKTAASPTSQPNR
jgi:monoterpene epsilon-lactone hydrolase